MINERYLSGYVCVKVDVDVPISLTNFLVESCSSLE